MVVRLSNKRAKTTRNAFLPLKWPFVGQPENHIGWATSLGYSWVSSTYPRTIFWNFGEKMFRIGGFEKLTFFETIKFQYSKIRKNSIFFSHSSLNALKILGYHTECSSGINYKIKVPQKFLQNPFLWSKWKVLRGERNWSYVESAT